MKEPILVVMAAGMGSRYGGLKQMDAIGENGEVIIDYSIHDAVSAGFKKAVIIIKDAIAEDFKRLVGDRLAKHIEVEYAYQEVNTLPAGYTVPADRVKPWGTCHAILSAKDAIGDAPFAVINADDFYGADAFKKIYDYLSKAHDTEDNYDYCMVGYVLKNTLTENGHVARGVCSADENSFLTTVTERTRIEKTNTDFGAKYTEDDGATWVDLDDNSIVSMNLWGFTPDFLKEAENRFSAFLDENLEKNPLKCEYFLPTVVNQLLGEKRATVKVLTSKDRWYGVTYHEDKETVVKAIREKHTNGTYPTPLWEE